MQSRMAITPVTADDREAVLNVWESSVRATHDFLNDAYLQHLIPLVKQKGIPSRQIHCIRTATSGIAGFIGTSGDEIDMLFVSPACFRQGIGTALLQFAITQLKCSKLDVNEQNTNALHFYRRLGFKVVGRSALDGQGKPYPLLHLELSPLSGASKPNDATPLPNRNTD